MEIDSADDNSNWLFDYGLGDFPPPAVGFCWSQHPLDYSSSNNACVKFDFELADSEGLKEAGSRKRLRPGSGNTAGSKAGREKLRRDKLNERFLELGSVLEQGRPPKMDKAAILSDAVRMVAQLRNEGQKLKESNEYLQEKIKELKAEKNELRDEKQRLKSDKEKMQQQVKSMTANPGFLPNLSSIRPAFAASAAAQGQGSGNKLMPFIGYPGAAMWQFMPPAAVDTSHDHVLRPPVA